jgi:hypothetical protein
MKYNTFRNLLAGGGALVATALVFYSCSGESNTSSNATNTNKATGGYKTSAAPGATITTEDIMKMFETPSNGSQKMKDAFSKSSTKVNLYDDKGTGKWNRAKVDYDRDEQDDEKWERDAVTGQITRVVSANDDGNFGPQQTWNGTAFIP